MAELETRRLGRTEMRPKALGIGGGHLGWDDQTDENAIATIRGAIERGINFVDTSPYYGISERRFGLALAGGWRDKVYLQTKVGSHPKFLRDWSRKATEWSLENSFRELQTDYVDSVLIHGPRHDIEEPLGDCLDVMLEWKAKGRIGAVGVGVRQHDFHRRAIETGEIDIVLPFLDYTLLNSSLAETTIPLAIEHDVGVELGSPLGGSMLAGPEPQRLSDNEQTVDENGELVPATIGGPTDPAATNRAYEMWRWCNKRGLNIRDLAMQFAMNAPLRGNGIVLTGPASPEQFEQAYVSATTEVPEEVWEEFAQAFDVRV